MDQQGQICFSIIVSPLKTLKGIAFNKAFIENAVEFLLKNSCQYWTISDLADLITAYRLVANRLSVPVSMKWHKGYYLPLERVIPTIVDIKRSNPEVSTEEPQKSVFW